MNKNERRGYPGKGIIVGVILWLIAMPGSFVLLLWMFGALKDIAGRP
jgi:hypothetical protein